DAIPSLRLGLIESSIRRAKERVEIFAVDGNACDASAEAHRKRLPFGSLEAHRAQLFEHSREGSVCGLGVDPGEGDHDLLASPAAAQILRAKPRAQQLSEAPQDAIAGE